MRAITALAHRTRRRHSAPTKPLAVIATTSSAATGGAPVNTSEFKGRRGRNTLSTAPMTNPATDVASPPPMNATSRRPGPRTRSARPPPTRIARSTIGSSIGWSTVNRLRASSRTSKGPSPTRTLPRSCARLASSTTAASAMLARGIRTVRRTEDDAATRSGARGGAGASPTGGGETTAVGGMGLRSGECRSWRTIRRFIVSSPPGGRHPPRGVSAPAGRRGPVDGWLRRSGTPARCGDHRSRPRSARRRRVRGSGRDNRSTRSLRRPR